MESTKNIIAFGRIASQLLCLPSLVVRAADELDINPAVRINGVRYFAEDDIDTIGERVRDLQKRKAKQ